MRRGFACIALDNPKHGENVGGAMRAVGVYGAVMLVIGVGDRNASTLCNHPTDAMKARHHIPLLRVDNVLDVVPFDCVTVAVDLLPDATPLPDYAHPERAFYIFGGEDATLDKRITAHCRDKVYVPTDRCMNLAATVNVVLYDRLAKQTATPTTGCTG